MIPLQMTSQPTSENHKMATPDWNNIDKFEETFPEYNCAFLDILGYKQKAVGFFDQRFNLYGRINRAFEVAAISNLFTSLLVNSRDLKVEIFSDSIIMTQPRTKSGAGVLLPYACHFASTLSCEGLFVRGGIAKGRHCRKQTDQGFEFLASEALQKAYLLEHEKAVFPRVLIDHELVKEMPDEERALVLADGTDYIVDFAHHLINREGKNSDYVLAEMTDIQSEMNEQKDQAIVAKLQWLLDYYYWTISTNPKWNSQPFEKFRSPTRQFSRI